MTVGELINSSLRLIGVLDAGETPSPSQSADALIALNDLLSTYNAQALPIPSITREVFPLSGAEAYTLGAGGAFNTPRPLKIKAASVSALATVHTPVELVDAATFAAYPDKGISTPFARVAYYEDGYPHGKLHLAPRPAAGGTIEIFSDKAVRESGAMQIRETLASTGAGSYTIGVGGNLSTERPLRLLSVAVSAQATLTRPLSLVTAEQWVAYPDKVTTAPFGEVLYVDGGYPLITLRIAPRPAAGSLELYSYKPLAAFAAVADAIDLPAGYTRALRLGLAADLAQEYGRPVGGELAGMAEAARSDIAALNAAVLGAPVATPPAAAPAAAPTE